LHGGEIQVFAHKVNTGLNPLSRKAVLSYFENGVNNAGMPRKLRVQYAGAIYHLMNRGDAVRTFLKMNRTCSVPGNAGSLSEDWVASSCLVFDGQSLSLGCENAKRGQAQSHAVRRVVRENAMTKEWIARRLRMGTQGYVSWLLERT